MVLCSIKFCLKKNLIFHLDNHERLIRTINRTFVIHIYSVALFFMIYACGRVTFMICALQLYYFHDENYKMGVHLCFITVIRINSFSSRAVTCEPIDIKKKLMSKCLIFFYNCFVTVLSVNKLRIKSRQRLRFYLMFSLLETVEISFNDQLLKSLTKIIYYWLLLLLLLCAHEDETKIRERSSLENDIITFIVLLCISLYEYFRSAFRACTELHERLKHLFKRTI